MSILFLLFVINLFTIYFLIWYAKEKTNKKEGKTMNENKIVPLKEREIPERINSSVSDLNKIMKMAAGFGIKVELAPMDIYNVANVQVTELKAFCWKKCEKFKRG